MITRKILLITLLASLILGMLLPSRVMALTEPTAITIDKAAVYQNVFEQGDWLFVIKYDIEYAAIQEYPISELFTFHVSTPAGTTIVSNSLNDNYINENLVSIYLSKNNAIAYEFGTSADPWDDWGNDFLMELKGSESFFIDGSPPYASLIIDSNNYFPGSSASYPMDYPDYEVANEITVGLLDSWLLYRVQEMEDESGVTLIEEIGGRTLINDLGSVYVSDAIPGYQEFSRVLSFTQYEPSSSSKEFAYDYANQLSGNIVINFCENVNNWSTDGASIERDGLYFLQGKYSLKFEQTDPIIFTSYCVTYTPDSVIDVGERYLNFDFVSSQASEDFWQSEVFIFDSSANWYSWEFTFQENIWRGFSLDLQIPDDHSAADIDLSDIESFVWCVTTSDVVDDFSLNIDRVIAKGVPGVGELTQDAFDGLGEWLGVGSGFVSNFFWMFVTLMVASAVFIKTSNSILSMVVSISVVLLGVLLGMVSLVTIALFAFLIVLFAAYQLTR